MWSLGIVCSEAPGLVFDCKFLENKNHICPITPSGHSGYHLEYPWGMGLGTVIDQKHFQVKIKLCRLQEANLMGNIPCSPCPLLWLPMGRGLLVRETPGHQILSK